MSIEDKQKAIERSKQFHDENSNVITFSANITRAVIFPADWHRHLEYKTREFDDRDNPGEKRTVTYTIYKVWNPNAQDAKTLRKISASSALNDEISKFLDMANNKGWNGACMARITKMQKGNSTFSSWSVLGEECTEEQLRELRIIE